MSTLLGTCDQAVAVVTSDTVDLAFRPRAIYVGGAGAITATMGGTDVVFSGVPVGTWLWISPTRIKTATTATLMLALI